MVGTGNCLDWWKTEVKLQSRFLQKTVRLASLVLWKMLYFEELVKILLQNLSTAEVSPLVNLWEAQEKQKEGTIYWIDTPVITFTRRVFFLENIEKVCATNASFSFRSFPIILSSTESGREQGLFSKKCKTKKKKELGNILLTSL